MSSRTESARFSQISTGPNCQATRVSEVYTGKIAFFLVVLMSALGWNSGVEARIFTPVGVSRGMDASVVTSVMFDSRGFLWAASREGLYRYDGYDTTAFLPGPDRPECISDIDIQSVYEDSAGIIWIATNGSGLDRYDPADGSFRNFSHDREDPLSISDNSVHAISEGPGGGLWIATRKGLNRLDRESGEFERFLHDTEDQRSLSSDWVLSLHFSGSGRLWLGTMGGGVNLWNQQGRVFQRYDLAELTGGRTNRNQISGLFEDEDGILWAGTREGLVRLDTENGTARLFDLGERGGYVPVITALQSDRPGRLWVSTTTRGLLVVNTDSNEWKNAYSGSLGTSGSLPSDAVTGVAFGSDLVFAGTWGSGVYRAPVREPGVKLLDMINAAGLDNNVISAVLASDADGLPWVGTFGGGPRHVDVFRNEVLARPLRVHGMRESGVMSLAGPLEGRLYAATTHGLYEFSLDGTQVALFGHDAELDGSIGDGYVVSLLQGEGPELWVGMGGSGLYWFNARNQRFTPYLHDPDKTDSLSGNFVTSLLGDGKDHIWVGTRSNGLNHCAIENWSCRRFSGTGKTQPDLSHHHVTSLYRDRRGRVWVGTSGGGLNQVVRDRAGEIVGFRYWNRENGLLSDGIMAIREDLDESLWLATRDGLSRINPATGDVSNHVPVSGLPVSHFNTNASADDGRFIYFGSTDGLLSIPKGSLLTRSEAAEVRISSLSHAEPGEVEGLRRWTGENPRIPHGEVISIELAVLDYSESPHDYAYRLQSTDPWINVGSERIIIFHGLAPGRYEFQARGRDAYGLWGESVPLAFQVIPPFWMTTWFRILVVALLLLLAGAFHLARQARLKRRANEMLRLGATRERALEEQLGSDAELAVLTPRQKETLQLIAEGFGTREIAELLGVSIKTVEAHRANLMERLDIRDVPGLVRLAIRTRLVSLDG